MHSDNKITQTNTYRAPLWMPYQEHDMAKLWVYQHKPYAGRLAEILRALVPSFNGMPMVELTHILRQHIAINEIA